MSGLFLRPLRQEDLDRVTGIESCIAGHPRRGFLAKRFAAAATAPHAFLTCAAEENGNVAGYGFARLQEGEFGARGIVAVLDVIGVEPDARGRGIGKAVISGIEREMAEKRITTLRTQVDWANRGMVGFFASAGFRLSPCRIIERDTSPLREVAAEPAAGTGGGGAQARAGAGGADYETLSRDRVQTRSLKQEDLAAVLRIDRKLTGLDRSAYYGAKFREVLFESGIRVSLVAEDAGLVTGFVMARVDFGEFGKLEKAASIDTIGVHPAYVRSGIGHALLSQLLLHLSSLQVESAQVQVAPENLDLQRFLHARGFVPSQRLVLDKAIR